MLFKFVENETFFYNSNPQVKEFYCTVLKFFKINYFSVFPIINSNEFPCPESPYGCEIGTNVGFNVDSTYTQKKGSIKFTKANRFKTLWLK